MFSQRILLYILLIVACVIVQSATSYSQNPEQTSAVVSATDPLFDISPRTLTLTKDTSSWVTAQVSLLNRGGSALELGEIGSSCGCASATVLNNPIHPLEVGKMLIRINTSNLNDSLSKIEFTIKNNTLSSPYVYRVTVRNPYARK